METSCLGHRHLPSSANPRQVAQEDANEDAKNEAAGGHTRPSLFFIGGFIEHTVDGRNPAPPRMMIIPLFIGF